MADFLTDIVDRISLLWELLLNFVESLFTAIIAITTGSYTIMQIFGFLPIFVTSCGMIILSFGIVKFLVGR